MASHRSKSLYAIKECSTCGRLYTKECCSIGSLKDKILIPEPDPSPCCARCGTPVDGPSCRGCAFLRKEFDEDLLAYCVENGIFKDFQDTFEPSDDNTNVVNALREPCVVNQDPGEKSSQEHPQIDPYCSYEVRSKKGESFEAEKYAAFLPVVTCFLATCDDEDDYIPLAITPDLPIEEPDNSLNMGDEHLDTIPATESDEVIKSSVENLVPIPSEFEGIFDDSCDIDPILEEFADELAHIAPIPPGIVEADLDDDTSSDDDDFEDVEYVSLEEVNEEKEFDLEDIFQIQDVILREKLLNVHRLISNIESLKVNSTPDRVLESPSPFPIPVADSDSFLEESDTSLSHLDNSLPEFETSSDHTEETGDF
ncbi:hypothetical protein Tco_0190728 [Tanacetum coccineum]